MKKIFLCMALTSILIFGFGINSYAILLLSGDGNITDDLQFGAFDNQQFFSNILEGGSSVAVLAENDSHGGEDFDTVINHYYNSLSGVSSSLIYSAITAANLSGIDLFVAPLPDDVFTSNELEALGTFYSGGGSIFFLGDNSVEDATSNLYINNALEYLGSGMSIVYNSSFDTGFHTATDSQIVSDALTSGVTDFQYGRPNAISVGDGGTTLFYGSQGEAFVGYERSAPVPEPSTILLLGLGLIGMVGYGRKRFSKKG